MPNWVRNKVTIENKNVLKELMVKNNDKEKRDYEDYYMDFNKVIPIPKTMHLTSGGNENISIIYALSKTNWFKKRKMINKLKNTSVSFYGSYYDKIFKYKKRYKRKDFKRLNKEIKNKVKNKTTDIFDDIDYEGLGIKNLKDLGNVYINNIIEYGFDTWYDWSCENWGTKWNSCHNVWDGDYNYVEFDTAWSCPIPIFKKISEKYNTIVEVDFADEDIGSNCGKIIFENGEITELYSGDDDFAYKVWGYSEEEIAEFKNEYTEKDNEQEL